MRKGGEMRSLEARGQPRRWDCPAKAGGLLCSWGLWGINMPGLKEEKIFTPNYLGLYPP